MLISLNVSIAASGARIFSTLGGVGASDALLEHPAEANLSGTRERLRYFEDCFQLCFVLVTKNKLENNPQNSAAIFLVDRVFEMLELQSSLFRIWQNDKSVLLYSDTAYEMDAEEEHKLKTIHKRLFDLDFNGSGTGSTGWLYSIAAYNHWASACTQSVWCLSWSRGCSFSWRGLD